MQAVRLSCCEAVLRDCIVLEEPYMGGFVGKELRLDIIEQVVKGQPPATDDERAERLDPVRGDLVRVATRPRPGADL